MIAATATDASPPSPSSSIDIDRPSSSGSLLEKIRAEAVSLRASIEQLSTIAPAISLLVQDLREQGSNIVLDEMRSGELAASVEAALSVARGKGLEGDRAVVAAVASLLRVQVTRVASHLEVRVDELRDEQLKLRGRLEALADVERSLLEADAEGEGTEEEGPEGPPDTVPGGLQTPAPSSNGEG